MGGEFGMVISRVSSDKYFVRPPENQIIANDLCIEDENGERLYIVGNNDWGFLALELLKPIFEEAQNIIVFIKAKMTCGNAQYVELGKNDKRILDIYYGGKCHEIEGLPVICSNEQDLVRVLFSDVPDNCCIDHINEHELSSAEKMSGKRR